MLNASRSAGFKLARCVLQSGARATSENFAASSVPRGAGFQKLAYRSTTILCVRKDGQVVMAGDGQASQGPVVAKGNVKKVRRIGADILVGFAGSTADAFSLLDKLEKQLEEHPGQLMRACVELAKLWRSDKYLRRLEAVLLVADANNSFEVTGNGDVLEPESGVLSIGSGSNFALAAATALIDQPHLSAEEIVRKSMKIAGDFCVYTNHNIIVETLSKPPAVGTGAADAAPVTPAAVTETAVSGPWSPSTPTTPK